MAVILNMARQLLELGREYIESYRPEEGLRVLRRLLDMRNVPPAIAAQANYWIAQYHFDRGRYEESREAAGEAIELNPEDAEAHFLFARSNDLDEEGNERDALEHYRCAVQLAPEDARKTSAYALTLARTKNANAGLRLLERTYQENGNDPEVVEDFVVGLMEAERFEDAELVITQASYRHKGDSRFDRVRRRMTDRLYHDRLSKRESRPRRSEAARILPFRNFSTDGSGKPRGPRRPEADPPESKTPARAPRRHTAAPPLLSPQMLLTDVLRKVGDDAVSQIYQTLGLVGKSKASYQRSEITLALLDRTFLEEIAREIPADSRKLLRTLVRVGGFVPSSTLFQNTGPESPPPDYVQPLLQRGLLYFGRQPGKRAASGLVAVIPTDLLRQLASLLRIKRGD